MPRAACSCGWRPGTPARTMPGQTRSIPRGTCPGETGEPRWPETAAAARTRRHTSSGLARTSTRIHPEAPASGNMAPESSHSGIRNRLITAWKPCVDSIGQAITNPSAVRENAIRNTVSTVSPSTEREKWIPNGMPRIRKIRPCDRSHRGSAQNLAQHDRRAAHRRTSTDSKKPSLRSSITDIMVKIEVNRTIITSTPGKK